MKNPVICIPVIDTTVEKMKKSIVAAQKAADYIELRVDYIEGVTEEQLKDLFSVCTKPSILTCRSPREGGKWKDLEEERRHLLQAALSIGFDFVDIELDTMKDYAFHPVQGKIILSYHNFEETPDYWDLTKIMDEMSSYSPTVYKIATLVQKEKDVEALFRLLTNKQGKTYIIAGMGEHGKIVRVLSPYLGNMLTFAANDTGSSAPGQIHYKDLQSVYQLIEKTI